MIKSSYRYIGLALLVVVAGVIVALRLFGGGNGDSAEAVTVRGVIGSEKAGLLQDPEVQRILKEKYGLTVDFKRTGSIRLVQADSAGQDFLWPGSQFARELFEQGRGGEVARSEVIFNSPIVLYAWRPVAQALMQQGLAQAEGETLYIDLPRLTKLIDEGRTWSELGVSGLTSRVTVVTTDPTKSNSGNLYAGLLANIYNGGSVADDAALPVVLPRLVEHYRRLGYLEESSGYLFSQFLKLGIGSYPLIAGYENQLIEFSQENEGRRELIQREIVILYPRPTVWAAHTLIALNERGQRLSEALKDAQIQRLAWQRHGFRSGVAGIQDDLKAVKLPGLSVTPAQAMPVPRASVTERIIAALEGGIAPGATPGPSATPLG